MVREVAGNMLTVCYFKANLGEKLSPTSGSLQQYLTLNFKNKINNVLLSHWTKFVHINFNTNQYHALLCFFFSASNEASRTTGPINKSFFARFRKISSFIFGL